MINSSLLGDEKITSITSIERIHRTIMLCHAFQLVISKITRKYELQKIEKKKEWNSHWLLTDNRQHHTPNCVRM